MLNDAGFDPYHPNAYGAITRLRTFQRVVREHSEPGFPTLVVNDGAVAYADVGYVRDDKLWKFIKRCSNLFSAATISDQSENGHGVRAVIALGLRRRGRADGIKAQEASYSEIIDDIVAQRINGDIAKKRAKLVGRNFDIVPQLQANFAFSRAYIAETSGNGGGFSAHNLYLDVRVFKASIPLFFVAGQTLDWKPAAPWLATLATSFVPIRLIATAPDQEGRECLRTGNELLAFLRFSGP